MQTSLETSYKLIRTVLTLAIVLFIIQSCKIKHPPAASSAETFYIIPEPVSRKYAEGQFVISSVTKVKGDASLKEVGAYLSGVLTAATGYTYQYMAGAPSSQRNTILLKVDPTIANDEGYRLSVNRNSIIISGKNAQGVFYGIQTLRQLFPPGAEQRQAANPGHLAVSCTEIADAPRFVWRGMMLDLSRHFIGMEEIKKLINSMAAHKMNRLHLHLSDNSGWRIEIKEYPKLTTIGALGNHSDPNAPAQFLTEKQGRELAEYARRRFITIVPEIDMPGHSGAVVRAYPELDGGEKTLNVGSDATAKFVELVTNRVVDIFNTKYFHFGSDEVFKTNWLNVPETKAKMAELGFKDSKSLEGWFDQRTAKSILDKNLFPVAWDEASDFGVDRRTIVQWWRCLEPEKLTEALHRGHQVIISPADHVYLDYPYNKQEFGAHWEGMRNGGNSTELIYNWEPVPSTLDAKMKSQVLGLEACVWTEFIKSEKRLEYMIYPRLSAFAEVAWSSEGNKNWNKFKEKLDIQIKRFEAEGFNFRKPGLSDSERRVVQPEAYVKN